MKVYVFSKRLFDKCMSDNGLRDDNIPQKCSIISIGEPDTNEHYFQYGTPKVLNIDFWDVNGYDVEGIKGLTDEQAGIICSFISENIGDDFYVHCRAGVSRSQAVAQFLHDEYGYEIESVAPHGRYPNAHVLSLLKKFS